MPQNHLALELIESTPQLRWVLGSPELPQVLASMNQVLSHSQKTAELSLRLFCPKDRSEVISRDASKLATGAVKDWLFASPVPLTTVEALIDHLSRYPLALPGLPPTVR